ncbi:hypothetical protein ACJIZ3_024055 [Penstemon smallii]|uniref:Probable glutathione S-transferase n=1 Tax=Penstemon smallii TaxID=265156 RepID=A0ABD3TQS5_9LAMI
MAEVKLFGSWYSPISKRVEMALKLKGVEYEFIDEDLRNKSPLLFKYNPIHKKVPVLLHNGKPIAESSVIIEYIDETWEGPSILPKDPYERAMARFSRTIEEKCGVAMWKAFSSPGEEGEKAKEEAAQLLKYLEEEIKGKKFFGGENIGLVDISANFIGYWFGIFQEIAGLELLTKEKYPNLGEWIDGFINHSFVKDYLPPKDKITEVYKASAQHASSDTNQRSNFA